MKKTREEMIAEMEEHNHNFDLDEDASYEEVLEEYQYFNDEICDTSDLFPNGRDYDAEDEDGPF